MQKIFCQQHFFRKGLGLLILSFLISCVEPYEPVTENLESALVVEGMITSKLKTQEIKLSQTYALEDDTILYVNNAHIEVLSSRGENFIFQGIGNGTYKSVIPFKAEEGIGYHLEIQADGKLYRSDEELISGNNSLENVTAERAFNDDGELGVAIFANTPATNNAKFFRYTYEETYKVVSPYTSNKKFIINDIGFAILVDVPEDEEREVCYNTLKSKKGILSDRTYVGQGDQKDLIKFLKVDDRKIITRYSILVKQNAISSEAFKYFKTLDELSTSESIFSQNQPGFIAGNIYQVDNPDAKVIGYFEVAKEDEKRIFFSFEDIFSSEERPDPTEDCVIVAPDPIQPGDIDTFVASGQLQYLGPAPPSDDPNNPNGPYNLVSTKCIDCKVLGTPEKPEFWIDDEE